MNRTKFFLLLAAVIIATICTIFGKMRPLPIERIERWTFDWHYSKTPEPKEIENLVLVLAGEPSFEQLGAWPWQRQTHARLLGWLGYSKSIMFDIIVPEKTIPSQDSVLANVIKTLENVIVAGHVSTHAGVDQLILPIKEVYDAAAEFGITNVNKDIDGLLRGHIPFRLTSSGHIVSLPVANAAFLTNSIPRILDSKQKQMVLGSRSIPLSDSGEVWVHYSNTEITQYEYVDILKGKISPEVFKDKIVIVGVSASGASDFYSVPQFPGSKVISGAEYNARTLLTLLWSDIPVRISPWIAAILCFIAAMVGAACSRLKPVLALTVLGVTLVSTISLFHLCFVHLAIWIDLAMPIISIIVSFIILQGLHFAFVHRDWEIQSRSLDSITAIDIQYVNRYKDFSEYLKAIWEKFGLLKQIQLVNARIKEEQLEPQFIPESNSLKIIKPGPNGMRYGVAIPTKGGFEKREFVLLGWNESVEESTIKTLTAVVLSNAWFFNSYKEAAKRKDVLLKTINAIFLALDFRDPITGGHSTRVSSIALEILKLMIDKRIILENNSDLVEDIYLGALVHDVGKIGIPDTILLKEGKLTKEEFDTIKAHPQIGFDIMKTAGLPETSINVLLQHHERYNGTGYPNGLIGEDISFGARVVAVADVYDALTCDRPYRKGWTSKKTCELIESLRGTDFDPVIVDVFLELKAMQNTAKVLQNLTNFTSFRFDYRILLILNISIYFNCLNLISKTTVKSGILNASLHKWDFSDHI